MWLRIKRNTDISNLLILHVSQTEFQQNSYSIKKNNLHRYVCSLLKIAQFFCPVVGGNYINVNTEFSSARNIQQLNKTDVQLRAGLSSLRS